MKKVLLLILASCLTCFAQTPSWTGVLSSTRAIDWSMAGANGTSGTIASLGALPSASWTQSGSTIAPCGTSGSPVSPTACGIQGALSAAGANQYVLLGAGYFYLSTGIAFPAGKSNLVLRGSGANQTFLIFSGANGCSGLGAAICVTNTSNPMMPSPSNTTTWTGGYSLGSTVITVGSSSGMAVGNILILDQCDSGLSGNPCAGTLTDPGLTGLYVCSSAASNCTNSGQGGAGNNKRASRSQQQLVRITNISGTSITITPPIEAPNWSGGNSPGVSWYNGNMSNDGVENLSIDCTACGFSTGTGFNIGFIYGHDLWASGIRSLYSQRANISFYQVLNGTVQHSYLMGTQSASSESYGVELFSTTNMLVLNNICQGPVGCVSQNAPDIGSVVLYNYAPESRVGSGEGLQNGIPSFIHHDFQMYGLTEGNNGLGWEGDDIHATHVVETGFRNLLTGDVSGYKTGNLLPVRHFQYSRFFNTIGNVLGNGNNFYTSYQTIDNYGPNSIYNLGEMSDPNTHVTSYHWGNWDNVTQAVRWCGNSSDPGWSTTCGSTSEVPTGLSFLPQSVPSSTTLPTTFFNGANTNLPSSAVANGGTGLPWWKVLEVVPNASVTPPFPPVGPDVTGGTVNGYSGYANYNPATLVWQNLPVDTHYESGNQAQATISTMSVSGHTATVTFTAAAPSSFSNSGSFTVNISGSSISGWNRNWQIDTPTPTSNPTSVTLTDPQIEGMSGCSSSCGTMTPTPILLFSANDYQNDSSSTDPPPNPPTGLTAVVE